MLIELERGPSGRFVSINPEDVTSIEPIDSSPGYSFVIMRSGKGFNVKADARELTELVNGACKESKRV